MARRASLIKKKKTTVRRTKTETYIINRKYFGDEIEYAPGTVLTQLEYVKAGTWYNTMYTTNDSREYLDTYLLAAGREDEAERLRRVSDKWFNTYTGWIARLLTFGVVLPEPAYTMKWFNQSIKNMLTYSKKVEDEPIEAGEKDVKAPSIQERVRNKASEILGDLEEIVDEKDMLWSPYAWLTDNNVAPMYAVKIIDAYRPVMDEIQGALSGKDLDLKHAYRRYSKPQLREMQAFYAGIVVDTEKYISNKKKAKPERAKRPPSLEKKLKGFKFEQENLEYKLVSIPIKKLISAEEAWAFNSKYKTLTRFKADGPNGLDIKGTGIIKFDENETFTVSLGRKAPEVLNQIMTAGKVAARKIPDSIKTKYSNRDIQARSGANTIFFKVG